MPHSLAGSLLEVLFPPRCAGCGAPGGGEAPPFCARCLSRLVALGPPGCRRCGRPLEAPVERCSDCPPEPVSWARAPLLYAGPARGALIRLKFSGWRSAAAALAPWMVRSLLADPPGRGPPQGGAVGEAVVTWVPLGRGRRRLRGYDQARALARGVSAVTGWPLRPLLRRTSETGPQARRSGRDRRAALAGAFAARGPVPPAVVLVDDVLTTGATAAECAGALVRAGAREVGVLTAARALGGPVPARCYNAVGLRSGSVVAPGEVPPAVDASRRRNDPRKATVGR